jgi:hypothetical protein
MSFPASSPFAATGAVVTIRDSPSRIYVADPALWLVEGYDPTGALQEVFRLARARVPVTAELIADGRESLGKALVPGDRTMLHELYDRIPHPDSARAIGALIWDDAGFLWIGHSKILTQNQAPTTFEILSGDGQWRGRVSIPPDAGQVKAVGYGRILTVTTDALGVQRVRVYAAPVGYGSP